MKGMALRKLLLQAAFAIFLFINPSFSDSENWHTGVNIAGGEFGSNIPGILGRDYIYPSNSDLDYFIDNGLTTFRVPFRWERVQPDLGGDLSATDIAEIDRVVEHAASRGATIVLDPHNYGQRIFQAPTGTVSYPIGSEQVSTADFSAFWVRIADRYKNHPNVIFGLMNEPHIQTADEWRVIVDEVVGAIRATGAGNLILVPGTGWDGAHSWLSSNAGAFETFVDPADNFAFEVHQYFDSNSSGTSDTCVSESIGADRITDFTQWLRDHNYRGFLGEFGVAVNATCMAALENTLQFINNNQDVWIGWTYWAAGSWWGDYMFSVQPQDGVDKPQLAVLKNYSGAVPPSGENNPPTAGFNYTISGFTAEFFDASTDTDGTIAIWSWTFGDGNGSTATNPSHTYAAAGTYTVSLTVTDDDGATNSVSKSVTVTAPPSQNVEISSSVDGSTGLVTLDGNPNGATAYAWSVTSWPGGPKNDPNPSLVAPTADGSDRAEFTATKSGDYVVSLTVTLSDGSKASASHTVTVSLSGGTSGGTSGGGGGGGCKGGPKKCP